MQRIDKIGEEIKISEMIKKKLLNLSKKTILRYIYATKRGEMDFPFRQYKNRGHYFIPVNDLIEWKKHH